MLPDFLIPGCIKGGTTAAKINLSQHPDIMIAKRELQFFLNRQWGNGVEWYEHEMTERCKEKPDAKLYGDKSPMYMTGVVMMNRMKAVLPHARHVIFLRNPVTRFFSHMKMGHKVGYGKFPPEEELFQNNLFLQSNLYRCGLYKYQLRHLFRLYPREDVHIAIAERVRANMEEEYNKIYEFLGVPPLKGVKYIEDNRGPDKHIPRERYDILEKHYRKSVEQLYRMLGDEIPEWESQVGFPT